MSQNCDYTLSGAVTDLHDGSALVGATLIIAGSEKAVQESIRNGRAGVMPAWKDILGEEKVHVISAYVYSLSNKYNSKYWIYFKRA